MRDAPSIHDDRSQGYDSASAEYTTARARGRIGAQTLRTWARGLPQGASVLDLGCGSGDPVSTVLAEVGLSVWAIDASPRMIEAYRIRFPNAPTTCESIETSRLFDRTFDAAVAVGLLFLLPPDTQRTLLHQVARATRPGGRFLFTAPREAGTWKDILTGRDSISLGSVAYAATLKDAGFELVAEREDEGQNHYYDALRAPG